MMTETTKEKVESPKPTAEDFAAKFKALCDEMGYQLVAQPVFIARDDSTFSVKIQWSVGEMSKTRLQCLTQIRSFLDETSAADWTDAELVLLINTAYHRVVTAVMTVYENYYLTTDQFNTTADQEEYDSDDGIATDIFKLRRVEVNYNVSDSNSAPTWASNKFTYWQA